MTTTDRAATTTEIRRHYTDDGHTVRISRNGRMTFRRNGTGPWLEGRWTSEYRVRTEGERTDVYLR